MRRFLAFFLVAAMLWGCAPAVPAGDGLTDDLGRVVTAEKPERVACLLGSFAQILHLAGGAAVAAPDDAWVDLGLPMGADAVNLGSTKELSLEALFASEPDLVLASVNSDQHLQWRETLEAAGISVAYFEVSDFEGYLRLLKVCTELTGREELYEQKGLAVQREIDEAVEKAAARGTNPKVLYLRISGTGVRAKNSKGTVLGQMLKNLGCVNIADTDGSLLENLSMEHILLEDPDYIFVVQQGDDTEGAQEKLQQFFRENPAWASLTAVREGRVFQLEKELYNLKPNDRWGEAYLKLEELLE